MSHQITIEGMSCQHCVHAVKEALEKVEGISVQKVEVGRAEVVASGPDSLEQARAAIQEEGFHVATIH